MARSAAEVAVLVQDSKVPPPLVVHEKALVPRLVHVQQMPCHISRPGVVVDVDERIRGKNHLASSVLGPHDHRNGSFVKRAPKHLFSDILFAVRVLESQVKIVLIKQRTVFFDSTRASENKTCLITNHIYKIMTDHYVQKVLLQNNNLRLFKMCPATSV